MVDCSHANSSKNHLKQPEVAEAIAQQLEAGERGIIGVMMESFLKEGKQPIKAREELTYGQSITDACLSFEQTVPVLERLAKAVRCRRAMQ